MMRVHDHEKKGGIFCLCEDCSCVPTSYCMSKNCTCCVLTEDLD